MKIEIAEPGRMTQTGSSLLKLIQNNNMPVLDLLVRESIQNSLDARKPDSKFVDVNFLTGTFENRQLTEELEGITDPLQRRFPNAEYDYLAVRDSQTNGLTGGLDYKKVKDNDYGNLLKLIYEICKPQEAEGAGGSWGLGKTVYFRIGIGLVIYYSRIKTTFGYASRLAASYVEDETKADALIPVYKGLTKRGIAWWGNLVEENTTQPITDEDYIEQFLKIFNISPYEGDETGTTIIIPYINKENLLTNNRTEYLNGKGQTIVPPWCDSIESYLSIATQRWYAPRLNNKYYTHGAYLRLIINGIGLGLDRMEPVFKVIQALYNRANCVKEEDILNDAETITKIESVNLRKCLEVSKVGTVAFTKVPKELLGMIAPHNKPEPYMYFNCEIRDEDVNKPTVCFTRQPAMVVSYENIGVWAANIAPTPKTHYIIAIFVLNSFNKLKNSPSETSLEEYVRRSEMADHTSWGDWSDGNYNPRIITKAQIGVNKIISKEFAPETEEAKPKANSGLGKMFGEMLLPPDGFGKRPAPEERIPLKQGESNKRGVNFQVLANQIKYLEDKMLVPLSLVTSGRKKIISASFELQIDSEAKRIPVSEWEEKLRLKTPFSIRNFKIDIDLIDGQKVDETLWLDDINTKVSTGDIHFAKQETVQGNCYGVKIFADKGHSLKLKITATIAIFRRDVKPAFVFKKEALNGR